MAAMETNLMKVNPSSQFSLASELGDTGALSEENDIAKIQETYPKNLVISLKDHLTLRGVGNSTVMLTPDQLARLVQSVLSRDDEYKEKEKGNVPQAPSSKLIGSPTKDTMLNNYGPARNADVRYIDIRLTRLKNRVVELEEKVKELEETVKDHEKRIKTLESYH